MSNNKNEVIKLKEVPNIISTKDLSYIKDMLNWSLTIAKKAKHYSELTEDKEIYDFFNKVNKVHKKHYEYLIQILE